MWHLVGIGRDGERLRMAEERIKRTREEINKYYWDYLIDGDFLELRNIADVATLTVDAALWRKESRGGHFRYDFPDQDSKFCRPSTQKHQLISELQEIIR
jgi:aspartate oxidase